MDENDENTMKILVATDIHLGYNENHAIRGEDSFVTFEEILKHAKNLDVDFLLLGGDLFHDTRPSTYCLDKCISLLRRYCLGDKEIEIEFLSDQSLNFKHCKNPQVNYEDPNYNIAIPVFSIHGNHDDPTGANKLSSLDLLSDIGLVNYFGKWTDLTYVKVDPLVISKGETKLAMFGLSHIRDERLSRLFKNEQVDIMRVQDDNIFNLLVLHQNRANRGIKNFIPEEVIPKFIDLVVWGHEHDCRIVPESASTGVQISQPGSSVATSLAEGESLQKHVGLLLINKSSFDMRKIPLKTVRPFVFKNYDHKNTGDDSTPSGLQEDTINLANKIIESMIDEAKNQVNDDEPKQPELPLIRLVFNIHNEKQQFNAIRLGQQYTGRVANPEDMILLKKVSKRPGRSVYTDVLEQSENVVTEGTFSEQVEHLLQVYMDDNRAPLKILTVKGLCEATTRFLENNDENAFEDVLNYYCEEAQKKLMEMEFDEDNIDQMIEKLNTNTTEAELQNAVSKIFNDPKRKTKTYNIDDDAPVQIDSDDSDGNMNATTSRGNTTRGRPARGRGSRGPRRARGRAKAAYDS